MGGLEYVSRAEKRLSRALCASMKDILYTMIVWSPGVDSFGDSIEKDTFVESFKKKYPKIKTFEKDGNICAEIPKNHEIMKGSRLKIDQDARGVIKSIGGVVNKFQPPKGSRLRAQEDILND